MTYTINVVRTEDYSGEHREWIERYTLPESLVNQIIADASITPNVDITPHIQDAQQAIRYADKFGAVKLDDVTLNILQDAVADQMHRKQAERTGGLTVAALITFMADFCDNMPTGNPDDNLTYSFPDRVKGKEALIFHHFRQGYPGWASAAAIQTGGSPEDHMR